MLRAPSAAQRSGGTPPQGRVRPVETISCKACKSNRAQALKTDTSKRSIMLSTILLLLQATLET